jgi:hypothetical protein
MLLDDFFAAVHRAFTKEALRIAIPPRPDPMAQLEMTLPKPESSQAAPSLERRLLDRHRLSERRRPQ